MQLIHKLFISLALVLIFIIGYYIPYHNTAGGTLSGPWSDVQAALLNHSHQPTADKFLPHFKAVPVDEGYSNHSDLYSQQL